ncbi:MAG: TetR family transcriptional regulator C-terminal domain-containing protein [Verrucomicrobiota bacterium]
MSVTEIETTKERLITSGLALMSEKSYHGAGLSEILKRADVPKGSFYHYFKSKENFAVEVIARNSMDHLEKMKSILSDKATSPMDRIYGYYSIMRDFYRSNGAQRSCLIAKLALEVSQLSEPLREAVKGAYDQWSQLLAETIREAQEIDEIDQSFDAEALANVLINDWEGATIRMQIEGNIKPLDDFFEVILEHGLKLKACKSD